MTTTTASPLKPRVTAVVVTHNRLPLLKTCLDLLSRQTFLPARVTVVDNQSTDGTAAWLETQAGIEIIRPAENMGSAGGFHDGLRAFLAGGSEYAWLLDDDCIPDPRALEELMAVAKPDLVLNSLVVSAADDSRLCFAGKKAGPFAKNEALPVAEAIAQAEHGLWPVVNPYNGMLISRSAIETVGLPVPGLVIWGDEVDYLLRVKKEFRYCTVVRSTMRHPPPPAGPDSIPAWNTRFVTLAVVKNFARFLLRRPRTISFWQVLKLTWDGYCGRLGKVAEPSDLSVSR
jgi:rhamnopyranosyl-N-acetylglucosaminyl-diphospho-decaprenol beta-1,3/1,4-galactofuranosyltransferase